MYSLSGILILEYENVLPEYICMIKMYSTLVKFILSIYVGVGTRVHVNVQLDVIYVTLMLTTSKYNC